MSPQRKKEYEKGLYRQCVMETLQAKALKIFSRQQNTDEKTYHGFRGMPGPERTRRVGMHMRPSRNSTIAQCLSLNCTRLLPGVPSLHAHPDTKSYKKGTREDAVPVSPQLLQEKTLGNFVEGTEGLPNAAQWCSRGDVYCAHVLQVQLRVLCRDRTLSRLENTRATLSKPSLLRPTFRRVCLPKPFL